MYCVLIFYWLWKALREQSEFINLAKVLTISMDSLYFPKWWSIFFFKSANSIFLIEKIWLRNLISNKHVLENVEDLFLFNENREMGSEENSNFSKTRETPYIRFFLEDYLPARKWMLPNYISILKVIIIEEIWTYGSFRGN